ncbi:MAG TPA: hypothetical protein VND45_07565 [Thermoanaerobaculia bacterium]|jgi:hypothetical protein|nr:hypothetical protein [Thermoanaerobaculia bacterium]
MRRILCLLLVAVALPASPAPPKKAKPGTDEFSIEATVLAVYNVVSGPAGRRDWNPFKDLFVAGGQVVSYENGTATVTSPDDYATKNKPYFDANGFFQWPVETRVERFSDIAHVTSRFESRHAPTDAAPFARGVAYFELVRSGDRWQVVSMTWQSQ